MDINEKESKAKQRVHDIEFIEKYNYQVYLNTCKTYYNPYLRHLYLRFSDRNIIFPLEDEPFGEEENEFIKFHFLRGDQSVESPYIYVIKQSLERCLKNDGFKPLCDKLKLFPWHK